MNIVISKSYTFVPSVFGNEKAEKPFEVQLHTFTPRERQEALELVKQNGGDIGSDGYKKIFDMGYEKVTNLEVNGEPVNDLSDIEDMPGFWELYDQIIARILQSLHGEQREADKKK